jgi:hypothetical protein
MRQEPCLSVVALFLAFLSLFAAPARAVVIEAGRIETSGTAATVDLIYFTLTDPGDSIFAMSPICGSCGVITTERSGIALYQADVTGGIGAFIEGDPGDAATVSSGISRLVTDGDNLPIGNYIIAVSWFELLNGELGPIQIDSGINLAFDYEVGFSGGAATNAIITCKASGNLDGTFSLDVRAAGTNCKLPTAAVPEPAPVSLALAGLLGLGLSRRRIT